MPALVEVVVATVSRGEVVVRAHRGR
jgi:hypothetical protein